MARSFSSSVYQNRFVKTQPKITWAERARGKFLALVLSFVVLIIGAAILHIWMETQVVNLGYLINHEVELKEELTQKNRLLALEIAKLRSPKRIEEIAKNELTMGLPTKGQLIYLTQIPQEHSEVYLASLLKKETDQVTQLPLKTDKNTKVAKQTIIAKNTLKKTNNKVTKKTNESKTLVAQKTMIDPQTTVKNTTNTKRVVPAMITKKSN